MNPLPWLCAAVLAAIALFPGPSTTQGPVPAEITRHEVPLVPSPPVGGRVAHDALGHQDDGHTYGAVDAGLGRDASSSCTGNKAPVTVGQQAFGDMDEDDPSDWWQTTITTNRERQVDLTLQTVFNGALTAHPIGVGSYKLSVRAGCTGPILVSAAGSSTVEASWTAPAGTTSFQLLVNPDEVLPDVHLKDDDTCPSGCMYKLRYRVDIRFGDL